MVFFLMTDYASTLLLVGLFSEIVFKTFLRLNYMKWKLSSSLSVVNQNPSFGSKGSVATVYVVRIVDEFAVAVYSI